MSSFTAQSGETEPGWRRANSCGGSACVEVATLGDEIAVRDSKRPDGAVLTYSREEWLEFLAGVKAGEFDLA